MEGHRQWRGIDGFVKEDQLGFNVVYYYQAKRWTGDSASVPPREVRDFSASLDKYPSSSTKGVFITTAQFSSEAKEYVKDHPKKDQPH